MKILALDSATEACSAALLVDGAETERYEVIGRGHAERLLPMVDELLAEAGMKLSDLDAVAFGRGPGGFTGLRIAAGLAQGLAYGAGKPVLPVSNLEALAWQACAEADGQPVLACLDARMGQVYWAAYACGAGRPQPLAAEALTAPAGVEPPGAGPWHGIGHGFDAYPEIAARLGQRLSGATSMLPRAGAIAQVGAAMLAAGGAVAAAAAVPTYLRDEVVHRR